jgi:hypothetical protein
VGTDRVTGTTGKAGWAGLGGSVLAELGGLLDVLG